MKEDLYPSMLWDSEEVRKSRIQVQKPWEREEFWSFYFSRRISIYVSLFLAKKQRISPNAITLAGIAAGLIAAAAFLYGSATSFVIGCFFYQMCYLADCVDGEVARMKKQSSAGGVWLDIGLNYALYLVSFCVIYGVSKSQPTLGPYLIYLILVTIFAEILATNGSDLAFGQGRISRETVSMRKRSKWVDAGVFLFFTQTGFQSGVLIAAMLWALSGQHQVLVWWTDYHLLVGLLRALYKLKLNVKYVTASRQEGGEANESVAHGGGTRIADQRAHRRESQVHD
ncbi:CDP-alcohol phosphatidyltransferase family protein [Brevibacillus sp. SAFN-007a]|uniref:CDP-alcohol phosphatidyltransferase family protein n=1 Tax=Brevibacillus sp. SAFN-007a TaxID=3436862 RepID=UPI003F815D45